MMQRRLFLTMGAALAVVGCPAAARGPFDLYDAPAPLLSPGFQGKGGKTYSLTDFAGSFVLLNIWATWCPPCRDEMPALDRLQAQLGGNDFAVVALCIDAGGMAAGQRFYAEIGITDLRLYWAEELRVKLAFGVVGLPSTLLIDRKGQEIARRFGPAIWDSPASVAQLSQLIAGA
jgi:thiol-disulfide isomerase/thioredoxin